MLLYLLTGQSPPDFFHDPFGQFIIAVVAIWVFRKQRNKKEISYQIISDAPIASVNEGLKNRVTIQFDGKPVKDARQIVLTIRNSGNVAVKRDDYEEPIRFTFEGSYIIGSDILNTEPGDLINSIDKRAFVTISMQEQLNTPEASYVILEKFLLNKKQSITLTLLFDRAYRKLDVRGRIVDGEIVRGNNKQSSHSNLGNMISIVIFIIMSFSIYFAFLSPPNSLLTKVVMSFLIMFSVIATITIIYTATSFLFRKAK